MLAVDLELWRAEMMVAWMDGLLADMSAVLRVAWMAVALVAMMAVW